MQIGEETSKWIHKKVRKGCNLSFILFDLDKITWEWIKAKPQGVKLEGNKQLETLLFANDQVVLAESEMTFGGACMS